MDVAPDSDLYDFVASLDSEHNKDIKDVQAITQPADEAAVAVDVCRLITDAVDDWSQRIFDAESSFTMLKVGYFMLKVELLIQLSASAAS